MIGVIIKHFIYEAGISAMFDNIAQNFNTVAEEYLRKYWCVFDEENDIIAYGYCIKEEGNLITLVDIDCEYLIHTKLFSVVPITAKEYMDLVEEDEEDDEQMKDYLTNIS